MYRKLLIALAVLAIAPFALAACGDDEDEETTDAATTEEATTTEGGGGGGDGSTVAISADPGGALAFEQDAADASAGSVTIEFTNDSSTPHDVRVESSGGEDLGGTDVIDGTTATASVDLEAGEYTFYCSVPGHREAGMEGTLTVD